MREKDLVHIKVWNLKKHVEALDKLYSPKINLFPITEVLDFLSPNWREATSPIDLKVRIICEITERIPNFFKGEKTCPLQFL